MAQTSLNSTGVASSGSLVLQTNGTTSAVTIDTAQNVGVGVTPSAWSAFKALQLPNGVHLASYTSGVNIMDMGTNYYFNGSDYIYTNTDYAERYEQRSGQHRWYNAASGTAGNAITFTQAMTLDASGNLLTGGTSLSNPAGWSKGIQVYNADYPYLSIKNSARQWDLAGFGSSLYFWDATAGAARMVLDSSGNLLVGTTSSSGAKVAFYKAAGTIQGTLSDDTGPTNHLFFSNPNGITGTIQVNGSSTSFNTSSDYRLKNSIAPMTGALAKVVALKPVTYKWNADNTSSEGFIAHELAEVCPQAVTGEKDAVDAEGNPQYQGIDTSFLVATLTAAIQEQQALITSLTARITALEGN